MIRREKVRQDRRRELRNGSSVVGELADSKTNREARRQNGHSKKGRLDRQAQKE